jgi:hypothetical protein
MEDWPACATATRSRETGGLPDPSANFTMLLQGKQNWNHRGLWGALLALLLIVPAARGETWSAIHDEMREALSTVSQEYFGSVGGGPETVASGMEAPTALQSGPWMIVVGFTGGIEKNDSSSSGVVNLNRKLHGNIGEPEVLALTYNNFRWRKASQDVLDEVGRFRQQLSPALGLQQPLIVVHGHSWGAGSVSKFAREMRKAGLEVSMAIFIDAFAWRNPRVPDNVRYTVNFYQRAGILRGLPMRGKANVHLQDRDRTIHLGDYRLKPDAGHWGWSWNVLQPMFYRQHHLIAHDKRLQQYLLEIVGSQLATLSKYQEPPPPERSHLFDRVVVMGASVSSGEKAPSPGLLLARHMGVPENRITTFAEGGAESWVHFPYLDNVTRLQPTLIIALDLFYHDFKASLFLTESRKQYLHDYIKRLHDTGAVVVLGNVPGLVMFRHEHVNRYLDTLQDDFPNLLLMDVRALIDNVSSEDGIALTAGGAPEVRLRKDDLFVDRIHPNETGNRVLANLILEKLKQRFPERLSVAQAGAYVKPLPLTVAAPARH